MLVLDKRSHVRWGPYCIAQKIIRIIEDLQLDRFMLHLPIGSMPHEDV